MSKSVGIRVSAVITVIGSLLTLLMAGSMVFSAATASRIQPPPDSPIPLKPVLYTMAALFAALTGWGIATGIGIFRRRGWARLSILIFAILLVGMGGSALIGILFIRFPENPNLPAHTMQSIRIGIAVFYGLLAVIGAWWLLLFNSASTKQYFAAREIQPGGRPLSISIIGWYLLISAFGTALAAILRVPAMLGGIMITGWGALLVYTVLTAALIYLGTGVLGLQEAARRASIVYFALIIVNAVLMALLPGLPNRMDTMMQAMPSFLRMTPPPPLEGMAGPMLGGTVIMAVPIWFLARRRSFFRA